MKSYLRWLVAVTFLFSIGAAYARNEVALAGSLSDIQKQQTALRAKAEAGDGEFKDMKASDRKDLVRRQTAVLDMIDGKSSIDELNEHNRVFVFNELEWIRSTIAGADDDRIVCERSRPSGSNRVVRTCRSVAEQRRLREVAEKEMATRNNCMDCSK